MRFAVAAVEVWIADVAAWRHALAELHALLDGEERERAAFFRFAAERERYTVAHGLLRLLLAHRMAVAPHALAFEKGPFGKPYLRADRDDVPAFNLAHSGERVAIAVACDPVGVDVQQQIRDGDAQAWARHEAVRKARGVGLSGEQPLDAGWTVRDVDAGRGYAAAVSARGEQWRPHCGRLTPSGLRLLRW